MYVISADWNGDVTVLEDTLGSRLCGEDDVASMDVWLSAHDGDSKLDRELDVIVTNLTWNDIGLFVLDKVLDLMKGLW